ncbi:MAG: protein kinase, partial [Actinomycetota bacterium]|nr:protein kinase [Actinomycetota bacterium]
MTAPLTETSPLGSLLAGRYEIRAPLGRGGMGEVFEAVDRRLGRTVAIKLLLPDLAADERFLTRFRWEAATAAGLSHLGIVSVHDIGEDAGRTFIVMEFVAGRTLADIARTSAPLDTHRIARVGSASARALAHAHERGIVHRDV